MLLPAQNVTPKQRPDMRVKLVGLADKLGRARTCVLTGKNATGVIQIGSRQLPCLLTVLGPGGVGEMLTVPEEYWDAVSTLRGDSEEDEASYALFDLMQTYPEKRILLFSPEADVEPVCIGDRLDLPANLLVKKDEKGESPVFMAKLVLFRDASPAPDGGAAVSTARRAVLADGDLRGFTVILTKFRENRAGVARLMRVSATGRSVIAECIY